MSFDTEPVGELVFAEDDYFRARYHGVLCHDDQRIVRSFYTVDRRQSAERIVTFRRVEDKFEEPFSFVYYQGSGRIDRVPFYRQ
jgi:hypothetical protein